MASTAAPIGQNLTKAQWVTWFKGFTANNPKMPKYTGDNASGKGKTWDQFYSVLYAAGQKQNPKATPDQVAQAEIELIQAQAVADGVGATLNLTGTTVEVSGKAAAATATQIGKQIPGLSAISNVDQFVSALGSANLWIRVAKVTIGGVILIVGLAKLTGLDAKAPGIVKTAVKAAPLLA
jgi:hypothetical protein